MKCFRLSGCLEGGVGPECPEIVTTSGPRLPPVTDNPCSGGGGGPGPDNCISAGPCQDGRRCQDNKTPPPPPSKIITFTRSRIGEQSLMIDVL